MTDNKYDGLSNEGQVHGVMLKLNREKPRELEFRRYLDQNHGNGISRKESILRLFDFIVSQGLLDENNLINTSKANFKGDGVNEPKEKDRMRETGDVKQGQIGWVGEKKPPMTVLKLGEMNYNDVEEGAWESI